MKSIPEAVSALSTSDARSALYYLSRYLKQAAHFRDYRKDVFEDTARSAPSETVRRATVEMIEFIGESEGVPAAQFDEKTYVRWSTHVRQVENGLDPDPTESDIARAQKFLAEFGLPNLKP